MTNVDGTVLGAMTLPPPELTGPDCNMLMVVEGE
jgi:hypothetical protein